MRELNLDFIGKLRIDADLRYLYTGEPKKQGQLVNMNAQVDYHNLSRLNFVKEIKPGVSLSTLVVWSCCLNDPISLVCISEVQANEKIKKA